MQLQHIQNLVAKSPDHSECMRALLAAGSKDQDAGVVFLGEEFQRGSVFEWVDFILLGEFLGQWPAERV